MNSQSTKDNLRRLWGEGFVERGKKAVVSSFSKSLFRAIYTGGTARCQETQTDVLSSIHGSAKMKVLSMRTILFTGKGGVGKTTLAAATALLCARRGHKTLIISTDAAHSLSDSFEVELGNTPRSICPNLDGQEVNALEEIEKKWGEIKSYLTALFASQGIDTIEAEELSVFPGMEELFSLMEIRRYNQTAEYEVIVVDCAPTGPRRGLRPVRHQGVRRLGRLRPRRRRLRPDRRHPPAAQRARDHELVPEAYFPHPEDSRQSSPTSGQPYSPFSLP